MSVILHNTSGLKIPAGIRVGFSLAIVVSVWICAVQVSPNFRQRIRSSVLFQLTDAIVSGERIAFADPYRAQPSNESVAALVALIEKYAPTEPRIAIFARNDDEVESLLLTGKTHLLDITSPLMCSASSSYSNHIFNLARENAGEPEYIFYDSSEGALINLQQEAFKNLIAGEIYEVADRIGDIIVLQKTIAKLEMNN